MLIRNHSLVEQCPILNHNSAEHQLMLVRRRIISELQPMLTRNLMQMKVHMLF